MGLDTEGKKVCLEAWGAIALRASLWTNSTTEVTTNGYQRQVVEGWTYDGGGVILDADLAPAEDYVVSFDVPAVTISHVGFHKTTGERVAIHALSTPVVFEEAGTYEILAASLEIDP